MTDVAAFVERAWHDGLGPDDRAALTALLAGAPRSVDPELQLFAAWFDLLVELAAEIPPAPPTPSGAVLHAAAMLARARITRDAAGMQAAIDSLASSLEALTDDAPNASAARAWADLALGDVALIMNDTGAAVRRFESVAAAGRPIALRITATLRMVGLTMSRFDAGPARKWARRALTLAESHHRPEHAARARLMLGMLDYVTGDVDGMRKTITPLLDQPESSLLARLLLASVEPAKQAMPLFADGLRQATETGDLAAYMMCILIGSRRYVVMGRRPDALVTISAGIVELRKIAPQLAGVLEDERVTWQKDWGPEGWAKAEADALISLETT